MASSRDPIIRTEPELKRSHEVTHPGDTEGAYSLVDIRVEPGAGPGLHIHNSHDEAFYVIEGQMKVQLGKEVVSVDPGAFVLVPKGMPHAHTNPGSAPNRIICVFSPGGMETYLPTLTRLRMTGQGDSQQARDLHARFDTESLDEPRII